MRPSEITLKRLWIIGQIACLGGAIDPLEGSLLIAAGAVLLAAISRMRKDIGSGRILVAAAMIVFGVAAMWYVSSLGGFDPKTDWWWLAAIFPYPAGWLMMLFLLLQRKFRKKPITIDKQ